MVGLSMRIIVSAAGINETMHLFIFNVKLCQEFEPACCKRELYKHVDDP